MILFTNLKFFYNLNVAMDGWRWISLETTGPGPGDISRDAREPEPTRLDVSWSRGALSLRARGERRD
jgi:hypothetical protein